MKTTSLRQNVTAVRLALLAGLFVLTTGLDARFTGAAAGQKPEPVFMEIPGVTTPLKPAVQAQAPVLVAQAACDLDVYENMLRKWVKDFAADPQHAFPGQMKPEQLRCEVLKPRRSATS